MHWEIGNGARGQVASLASHTLCEERACETEVVNSEHVCSGKMLLLLSHCTHGRGAEARLVTGRQEAH